MLQVVVYAQSSAPEDGQNNFPKHVELTGIINKPLLLHLVGCLRLKISHLLDSSVFSFNYSCHLRKTGT